MPMAVYQFAGCMLLASSVMMIALASGVALLVASAVGLVQLHTDLYRKLYIEGCVLGAINLVIVTLQV